MTPAESISGGMGDRGASAPRRNPLVWVVLALVASILGIGLWVGRSPPSDPARAIALSNEGIGKLEFYDYTAAYDLFSEVVRLEPEWVAAHVNRGLAALNLQDEEKTREAFGRVLELDPGNPHAHFSLGILSYHLNDFDAALERFRRVEQLDPEDPHTLYYLGSIYADKDDSENAIRYLRRALHLQPSFGSAWFRLAGLYRTKETREERMRLLGEFQRLKEANAALLVGLKYGEGGRYNLAVRNAAPPGVSDEARRRADPLRLGPPRPIVPGHASAAGAGFALVDLDADDALELVVAGAVAEGSKGTAVWARADGGDWQLRSRLPFASQQVAAGDLDGDRDPDLVLAVGHELRLLSNDGAGGFSTVEVVLPSVPGASCRRLLVLDLDSDWDLDIVALFGAPEGGSARLLALRNNRDGSGAGDIGTFEDVSTLLVGTLTADDGSLSLSPTELLVADLDGDVDLDVLLLDGESGRVALLANDRAWKFRDVSDEESRLPSVTGLVSTASGDVDGDGREDIVLFGGDWVRLWRGLGALRFEADASFEAAHGGRGASAGAFVGVGDEARSVLLVAGASDGAVVLCDGVARVPLAPVLGEAAAAPIGVALNMVRPEGVIEWLERDAAGGLVARSVSFEGVWIALDLEGPRAEDVKEQAERSNPAAIGATVELRVGAHAIVQQLNTGSGGVARNATRLVAGLGGASVVDYARILWPDGILQAELALAGGRLHSIHEKERKPTSCPVLFAWTGEQFEFVADFLGVGGLGYFEAPGRYNTPDPTEILHLPRLAPRVDESGETWIDFRVLEPLEECTYLDSARLLVVDHPPDVSVLPLEMFAIAGPPPGYELLAFRRSLRPRVVVDQDGRDVTAALERLDRRYAPALERDGRFAGVLRRPQSIVLEFDGELDDLLAAKVDDPTGSRPVLFLHGYIEYGYSTTNYAASQAGFEPLAPTFSVERGGEWVVLRDQWGFPGGYPRWMAVDLADLLEPGDRRLRIETNLEIAWDEALLARAGAVDGLSVHELDADVADLRYRGFPVDPRPGEDVEGFVYRDFESWEHYKAMPGDYTRFGDVRELLSEDDDRFVVFGPGDEIVVRFRADRLPELDGGVRRSYFWKSGGYCKDMDLYTGRGDGAEPLPFASMPGYPYPEGTRYPVELERYRSEWNTRRIRADARTMIGDLSGGSTLGGDSALAPEDRGSRE